MCPENHLPNGSSFLTEWFVLVPQNYYVFEIKMAKPCQTHCLLQNGIHNPFFSIEWRLIADLAPAILWRKWQGGYMYSKILIYI